MRQILDLIYPRCCALCERVPEEHFLCADCQPRARLHESEWLLEGVFCELCGDRVEESPCLNCRLFPIPRTLIRSIWHYSEGIEEIIKAYKYAGGRALAEYLTAELLSAIRAGAFPAEARWSWDLVMPVPSTPAAISKRGYGHVAIIARQLGKKLRLPCHLLTLQVRGKHPAQASLRADDRLKHLHRKFISKSIKGRSVLLIDDVITSGASIIGSALALRAAGALRVDVLSLARTEQFTRERRALVMRLSK